MGQQSKIRRTTAAAPKVNPPLAGNHEIVRDEVGDYIFSANAARLILVRAAAGFGKTTVMRQVRQRCTSAKVPSAWLTIDAADNDVRRFVQTLDAALEAGLPKSKRALGALIADSATLDLVERVASLRPFVLFLDEFENLQSPAALSLVKQLIEHLPEGARMIVGSRTIPSIGLGRLRARGQLLDVEPAHLRFSLAETANLLCGEKHLNLSSAQVAKLHQRTEGWPAAITLASLALERRETDPAFIDNFSGSDAAIAEYLAEDVLARQPPEWRNFLLTTSVLENFDAALCDAVCGIDNSRDLLTRLEQANLFLIPLDAEHLNYRYHSLFSEFLRAQLERESCDRLRAIHLAAAEWYLKQERPVRAIEHALASGDLDRALPLLDTHAARLLDDARMRLLDRWLSHLPAGALSRFPKLRLIHAWVLSFVRTPKEALVLLEDVSTEPTLGRDFTEYVDGLRPLLLSQMDRPEEAYQVGQENLARLSEPGFPRHMALITLATVSMILGRFAEARSFLGKARRIQTSEVDIFSVAVTESIEGALDLLSGRLRQATVRLRAALNPSTSSRSRNAKENAMAGILLAEALYEADELEPAHRLLSIYAPIIKDGGLADQIINGHVLLARIAGIAGDTDQHFQLTMELEHLGYRLDLRRAVASARLERARFALLRGDMPVARAELDAAQDRVLWERVERSAMVANDADTLEIGTLRLMLRDGRAADAISLLHEACERAVALPRRALKLRILLAEALSRTGQHEAALTEIGQALAIAAPEGFLRTFIDEGDVVLSLVRQWQSSRSAENMGETVAPEFIRRLLQSDAAPLVEQPDEAGAAAHLLTRKEIEVLRLAAAGMLNREISDRLFVSLSTVRTHMRNINTKLGVHSRVQAIVAVRRSGVAL